MSYRNICEIWSNKEKEIVTLVINLQYINLVVLLKWLYSSKNYLMVHLLNLTWCYRIIIMIYFQCETVLTFNIFKLSLEVQVENIEVVFRSVRLEKCLINKTNLCITHRFWKTSKHNRCVHVKPLLFTWSYSIRHIYIRCLN